MRPASLLLLAALLAWPATSRAERREANFWPFWIEGNAGNPLRPGGRQVLGPVFFSEPRDGATVSGMRPVFVRFRDEAAGRSERHVLYPLFSHFERPAEVRWSLYSLINHRQILDSDAAIESRLEVFPFYFSRQSEDPETSYRALFPIRGTVAHRFGQDRISWTLFPLYARWERDGTITRAYAWPFIKVMEGEAARGFDLWPLFGRREKKGDFQRQFALWPLYFRYAERLWLEQPDEGWGILPFYTRHRSAEAQSESFLWPFFGYTRGVTPEYREIRYFWPLLVQSRGEDRLVNRWAPFYTLSRRHEREKLWVLWPLFRRQISTDAGLEQTQRQFLYFIYHSTEVRNPSMPEAGAASRTHLWPLASHWDNGAGRRQFQLFSPLEVFFPNDRVVRAVYSPLFAIARYERDGPQRMGYSLLFGLAQYRRDVETFRFDLGPVLTVDAGPEESGFSVLKGLIARRSDPEGSRWRFFWLDIRGNTGNR